MPVMPPRRWRSPPRCRAVAYFTKWIIAVDEDIDPSNMDEVLWGDGEPVQRDRGHRHLAQHLEHAARPQPVSAENRPYGSKALINLCKPHKHLAEFSKRTMLRREIYDEVVASWQKLGLPGTAPGVSTFETDS